MTQIKFFNSREKVDVSIKSLGKHKSFGGQARIYEWVYNREKYIIKAFYISSKEESLEIFRRMKDIRKALTNNNKNILDSIAFRGLHVAQGSGIASEFGFQNLDGRSPVPILVFNYVEGYTLLDYLKNQNRLSPKRKKCTNDILDALIFLQDHMIVHGDLYPDNFMVDTSDRQHHKLYIIDLESAGIKNSKGNWLWEPLVAGKEYLFPNPPEIRDKAPSIFSDRWIGMYLIFWALTGRHPLNFLTRIDYEALHSFSQNVDNTKIRWPPLTRRKSPYINIENYDRFKHLMENNFRESNIGRLLFFTYINGLNKPSQRADFRMIKESLRGVI